MTMIMNNRGNIKTFWIALGMAALLFVYGYAASRWGHDHSQHEHQEELQEHDHDHTH